MQQTKLIWNSEKSIDLRKTQTNFEMIQLNHRYPVTFLKGEQRKKQRNTTDKEFNPPTLALVNGSEQNYVNVAMTTILESRSHLGLSLSPTNVR